MTDEQFQISILVPAIINTAGILTAVLGWLIAHHFQAKRDQKNKRREIRLDYEIKAFQRLAQACQPPDANNQQDLGAIMADIQLFGTTYQITLAHDFMSKMNAMGQANSGQNPISMVSMEELLESLRNDLRKELELDASPKKIVILKHK